MREYDVEFAGYTAKQILLHVVKRPSIPSPEIEYETFSVPGRDGDLHIKKGVKDIEIPIELNYIGKPEEWFSRFRKAKKWLLGKGGKLRFGDDENHFYNVKKVTIDTNERICLEIGRFTAVFTCAGYCYLTEGAKEREIEECLFNPYETCHPTYKIVGEGMCYLTINGKRLSANVSGNVTIDTERMLAYREDGLLKNTIIAGDYEDLYLNEGENTISFSGGECKIIPNWREL